MRIMQFIFAIIVAILYGLILMDASKASSSDLVCEPSDWAYAEVVAGLSGITCLLHLFIKVNFKRVGWCIAYCTWDGVLFILWLAQTAIFGSAYYSAFTPFQQLGNVTCMRAAVWIDLVNMLLWLASTGLAIAWCISARRFAHRTDLEQDDGADKRLHAGYEDDEYGLTISRRI